jgi:phytoene/squalene synthetase
VNGALERSYAEAERATAQWARSFHFASRFVPLPKRRAIFALYHYCRFADNLVDLRGDRSVEEVRRQLALLGGTVRALHAGAVPDDPRWLALADTLRRCPVPLPPLLELLEGVAMDLEPVEIRTFAELERYSYSVAGVVGLMLGPVLGAERQGFMAFQVRRARQHFAVGDAVVGLFPADGSRMTVRLMQRTYAGILDAIERHDYDVFRLRAHVSSPRKLAILGRAIWQEYAPILASPTEQSA